MESVANWQQGSTFTILLFVLCQLERLVTELEKLTQASLFAKRRLQPRTREVVSVPSCLECSSVLEDELAYLQTGLRTYQRQASRISRLLRFLGKSTIHLFFIWAQALPPQLINNLCLGFISDQKGNKSSVASDTGQVLSSVVWGENAEGNKVRYPHSLLSFRQRTVRGRTDPLRGSLGGTPLFR